MKECLLLLLISVPLFSFKTTWREVRPISKSQRVEVIIKEKQSFYYELKKDNPLVYKLTGPLKIKFLIRAAYKSQLTKKKSFSITTFLDKKELKNYTLVTIPSDVAVFSKRGDFIPSQKQEIFLEIPKGEHMLELNLHFQVWVVVKALGKK